ncbi:MAG: hypothetical protein WA610_13080 [Thermodesulfovibrionales bacterium]
MDLTNSCFEGTESCPHLAFVVDRSLIPHFFLLLQQGVTIRSRVGCSIGALLREEIGATAGTIEKIQSIILDGSAVDDIESAVVKDGSILALSAAMPGLVGATLRRGGAYSSFRNAITYHETGEKCSPGEGFVQIKLFNLLMAELGPALLQKGVILSPANFLSLAAGQPPDFWQGCRQITLDSRPVDGRELLDTAVLSGKDRVFLSVSAA